MSIQDELDPTRHSAKPSAEPGSQPTAGDDDDAQLSDTLRAELEDAIRQAEEYLRLAQRTQADFVNYRRRTEEERARQAREANLALVMRLLPVLDDFERARAGATPADLESAWGKGVELVERNLRGVLASEGVERIEVKGPFDPHEHEAISYLPMPNTAEGQIIEVVRPGYRKGERVIRPAQVVVAGQAGQ